jgi:hypothetical protein
MNGTLVRPLAFLAATLLSFSVAQAADFTPEAGYISLFNGKDLTGWTYKGGPAFDGKPEASDGRYTAKDGMTS